MDFTVISMPKVNGKTTFLINDVVYFSTIQSAIERHESRIFHDEGTLTTSTPYPVYDNSLRQKSSTLKVTKNPMEQSILKNSQCGKPKKFESGKEKKKVFFTSPEVVEISSIDKKMRKSFLDEQKQLPKGTPVRHQTKIRPRLLNFTESKNKFIAKGIAQQDVKVQKVKRLTGGKKTSPIHEQQKKEIVSESFLKGVRLNRRFELMMKNLMRLKVKQGTKK